jgi:hypothetical protein
MSRWAGCRLCGGGADWHGFGPPESAAGALAAGPPPGPTSARWQNRTEEICSGSFVFLIEVITVNVVYPEQVYLLDYSDPIFI